LGGNEHALIVASAAEKDLKKMY